MYEGGNKCTWGRKYKILIDKGVVVEMNAHD
jgi:hypothetical protein